MEIKPWMQNLTAEDMPNHELKYIACVFGVQFTLDLILKTPGIVVNIPKNAFKIFRDKYILKNYDGTRYSIVKLAVECQVTERYIYTLLKKKQK